MDYSSMASGSGSQYRYQSAKDYCETEEKKDYLTAMAEHLLSSYDGDFGKLVDTDGNFRGVLSKRRLDFGIGGSAILACLFDMVVLTCCLAASIMWGIWIEPVTKYMVGFESAILRSTFISYVDMHNITSEKLVDGKPKEDYIILNATIDGILSVIQLIANWFMICIGPSPRNLNKAVDICKMWLILNVTILLVYAVWRIVDENWITLVTGLVIRGGFIIKVIEFIYELRRHAKTL